MSPALDDLCSCIGVVWINGCFATVDLQLHAPGSTPRRSSEQELNSTVLVQQSPSFRRRLSRGFPPGGADAGTEQWYKTIAKLMQGRNRNSTLTCEPRASALWAFWPWRPASTTSSYLVDPASSHMLVLKIKPCMSKYKHLYRETANGSLKQLWFI